MLRLGRGGVQIWVQVVRKIIGYFGILDGASSKFL